MSDVSDVFRLHWAYLHLIGQATHAWPRDVSPRAPMSEALAAGDHHLTLA